MDPETNDSSPDPYFEGFCSPLGMERISHMDKVTNEDVLKRVEDRSILNGMWQRKHGRIGRVTVFCKRFSKEE